MKVRDLVPWGRQKSDGAQSLSRPESLATRQDYDGGVMQTLRRDINSVFDRFFDRFDSGFLSSKFQSIGLGNQPSLDISEGKNKVTVRADLPGMDDDDIDLSLTGDVLTIRGERKEEKSTDEDGRIVQERRYGAFYRTVQLPANVKPDGVIAKFKNGVLTMTLPKQAGGTASTKRIDVRAA